MFLIYKLYCCTADTVFPSLCLRFKGLAFNTEWIELPDIEKFSIKNGIAATSAKKDGSPFYTLPAIYDPSTGIKLADSWEIALYLDKTYPDTPRLIPEGTVALQRAFTDSYGGIFGSAVPFLIENMRKNISPGGLARADRNLTEAFGKPVEELIPKGDEAISGWAKYQESLKKLDTWYAASDGPFLTGETPVWVDLIVGSMFIVQRNLFGKENKAQWKEVTGWHNGRWGRLVELLEERRII
jgi:glutathione S-transferase